MIKFFCGLIMKHEWEILDKKFIPGKYKINIENYNFYNFPESEFERLLVGYTIVSARCTRCGKLTTVTFAGKI